MSVTGSLLEAVAEVARHAGAVAYRYYRTGVVIETKADGSPVTIADRSAERAAREWIAQRFPSDGIVGEEEETVREGAARRWILDPIDGTAAFVRGVPLWGTLIAVVEGDEVLAGCAHFPAVAETIAAARGEGCWLNGGRTRVSSVSNMSEATVLTTDAALTAYPGHFAAWNRLAAQAKLARTWGDCYGYLLVASGRAEVMTDAVMNPWDSAAVMPVIEEAGGVFTSWNGTRTAFGGSSIATNASLALSARTALAL